ncbi:uncharacterized protein RJT21DRAFT_122251 [Scheffersomyces amazonensis]|uniref:uncharacterized protein n=1 Tax=Scheffersomyces amazonensis TaxID=1078765 RepID=UPI00315C8AC1
MSTHQRKQSKASFYIDLEKSPKSVTQLSPEESNSGSTTINNEKKDSILDDDPIIMVDPVIKTNHWMKFLSFVFILIFIFTSFQVVLSFVNLNMNEDRESLVIASSAPPLTQSPPLSIHKSQLDKQEAVLAGHNYFPYKGEDSDTSTSSTKNYGNDINDKNILDVSSSSSSSSSSSPLQALKEIFAVNPIIIISNNNPLQHKFETILMNINIHPEPKIVDLLKHPDYSEIMSYLEVEFADELEDEDAMENDDDDIPRLFIAGKSYGNYYKIFKLYESNLLQSYLREHGKGKITIG